MNVFSFHESLEMFVERSIYPSQRKNLKKQWIQFLSTLEIVHPLKPRKAFLGGRINALTLHYVVDVSEGQQIEYVDFTSLYPWVKRKSKRRAPCWLSYHHRPSRRSRHQTNRINGHTLPMNVSCVGRGLLRNSSRR